MLTSSCRAFSNNLAILYNPNIILVGLLSIIITCNCMIITPTEKINGTRFILSNSVILGYLYTPIFKNIPFVKNFVVSFIISQSIIVGCLVANGDFKLIIPCLTYLFNLIMWQEIMLNINDREGDKNNNIMTIPVKYGYKTANKIALCFLLLGRILPYGFSLQFILLQMPLILINIRTIQKNKILNKITLKIANFIMLLSGLYMCI